MIELQFFKNILFEPYIMAEWRNSPTNFPNPVGLFFNIQVDGLVNMNENNGDAE